MGTMELSAALVIISTKKTIVHPWGKFLEHQ